MHQSSYTLMQKFAQSVQARYAGETVRVLDIGSAGVNGTYQELFRFEGAQYVGLDIQPGPNVDVVPADPYDWAELEDESFDVIISGQALEHIEFPWVILEQIAAKLKPQGLACLIAPSRGPEHRYPIDCYRYYADGLRALAKWSGLKVLECDYIRGASGFDDGSDQWGDCHCILTRDASQGSEAPRSRRVPVPVRAVVEPKHLRNPLSLPRANYFGFERFDVIKLIVERNIRAKRVIELGCAAGSVAKNLKSVLASEQYIGVEIDPSAAAMAEAHLDKVYVADVETVSPRELGLASSNFDLLLALDVLEHLYNPWDVLAQYVELLRTGGYAVLSIPNIANVSVIEELARGHWTYESAGLLDITHLRFFGMEEALALASGAGLTVVQTTGVFNPQPSVKDITDQGNTIRSGSITLAGLARADVHRLFTYQFLLLGQKTTT